MAGYFGAFVVPVTLAAPTDLATWTGTTAPANAVPLLRSATSLVLAATSADYYTVDPLTGISTDAIVKQALQDAVCIQAAAWAALGFDPLLGGVVTASVESSAKISSALITFADANLAAQARGEAFTTLVPDAERRLRQVDLLRSGAWAFG
jgi:hypothetical protein